LGASGIFNTYLNNQDLNLIWKKGFFVLIPPGVTIHMFTALNIPDVNSKGRDRRRGVRVLLIFFDSL